MLRCFLTEKKWYVILWFLQCSLRHNTLPSQIRVISEVLTNEPWNIKKRQLGNLGVCSKTFVTNICYESHFDNAPYSTPWIMPIPFIGDCYGSSRSNGQQSSPVSNSPKLLVAVVWPCSWDRQTKYLNSTYVSGEIRLTLTVNNMGHCLIRL